MLHIGLLGMRAHFESDFRSFFCCFAPVLSPLSDAILRSSYVIVVLEDGGIRFYDPYSPKYETKNAGAKTKQSRQDTKKKN